MHGHKRGDYKDGDNFLKAILNLESEFQESIKKVLRETSMVPLMIDSWSDDAYRKYLGVIVCFVPNLAKLNDISYGKILNPTKSNEGGLQCKIFIALKPTKDASESVVNLVEWILEVRGFYEIRDKVLVSRPIKQLLM